MFRQSNFAQPLLQLNWEGEDDSLLYNNKEFGCQNWTRGFCGGPKCCKFCNHSPRETLFMMFGSSAARGGKFCALFLRRLSCCWVNALQFGEGARGRHHDVALGRRRGHDWTAKLDAASYSVVLVCRSNCLCISCSFFMILSTPQSTNNSWHLKLKHTYIYGFWFKAVIKHNRDLQFLGFYKNVLEYIFLIKCNMAATCAKKWSLMILCFK